MCSFTFTGSLNQLHFMLFSSHFICQFLHLVSNEVRLLVHVIRIHCDLNFTGWLFRLQIHILSMLLVVGMCGDPKVGLESVLEKPTSKILNQKSGFCGILKNWKPKLNIHNFSNVCILMESFSWSSPTLQIVLVMFTTVYNQWPAGIVVKLQINKMAISALN